MLYLKALTGLAIGIQTGPLFGSIFYQITGDKVLPYCVISVAALLIAGRMRLLLVYLLTNRCLVVQYSFLGLYIDKTNNNNNNNESINSGCAIKLFLDPYIIVCIGRVN